MVDLSIQIIIVICSVMFLSWILFSFIEHGYALIFKKPLYVHFYLKLKKLPASSLMIIEQQCVYYAKLTPKAQLYFEHRVASFLKKYTFSAQDNSLLDDKLRVMVASAYVMLTFGMRHYLTNAFKTILIHPDSYYSAEENQLHNGEFNPKYKAVVFSRRAVLQGFQNNSDNLNLAIHEFAHVLTYSSMKGKDVSASIFSDQNQRIIKKIKQFDTAEKLRNSTYFRTYAFTNEFEFVAVVLEHYFESPNLFENEFPDLYQEVRMMINQ